MKKTIQTLIFLLLLVNSGISKAQGELTSGVQTSTLSASISSWVNSTSDKNSKYYAISYWVSGIDCGNYLKVYNGTTFTATSPQTLISTYHGFTRVRLDDNNNVYVLYVDRTYPGSTTYKTYLKKYNTSGIQIGSRIQVANNTQTTDIEVAPNGDVLIGCVENNKVKVKVFRNMLYKGYLPVGNITSITNTKPFSIQMDMKQSKFVVGYSYGSITSPQLHIKRYNYSPIFIPFGSINLSSLYSHYSETGSRFERDNNQIALRDNWDVFYNVNVSTSYPFNTHNVRYLNPGGSTTFQNSRGFVDVDINNRLLISRNYGSINYPDYKINLYSNSNSLIHNYIVSDKIENHLESIAIYDCEFVITGIDRKLGANPLLHTYQSFHQVFNCKDCRPNMGATAVAKFKYPYQVNPVPSKYGPLNVTELCLVDDLLVDGSLSSCETSYFVELSEFNPMTWTNTLVLHSDWITPLTEAPNNINIVDFLPAGYHLRPGKIYKFRLAVGNPWDSVDIFFEVSCCEREIVIHDDEQHEIETNFLKIETTEEIPRKKMNFDAYPNPVVNSLSLDFNVFGPNVEKKITVKNSSGINVLEKISTEKKETINTKKWKSGLYIITITINDETYSKKIIKK